LASQITKTYPISQEQLYSLAVEAALAVRYVVRERNDDNFTFTVETGINWRSVTGTVGNISVRSVDDSTAEIAFGGGQARSSAGNILLGQIGVIGGVHPIANKILAQIDERVSKGQVPEKKTKLCPYCAEVIKVQAVICKHCGKNVNPSRG
jgi:hypothetical protein